MTAFRNVILAFVVFAGTVVPASAAITHIQSTSCAGNDTTCTFTGGTPSSSNRVFVVASMDSEAQTLTISGWDGSFTTLTGPTDSTAGTMRGYAFCLVPDGADTTFIGQSSGAGIVTMAAVEVSGSEQTCTSALDDTTNLIADTVSGTSHAMATPMTTSQDGDLILGLIDNLSGGANWTATNDTASIDASDAEIAGGNALGMWRIAGAAGTEDITFSSVATEQGLLIGISIKAAAGGGGASPRGTLLGVLP